VRALGRAGFFHSRLPSALLGSDIALYDPAPLRERLASSLDFEIDGRLLGDGGLSANAPAGRALDWSDAKGDWAGLVVDLFFRASGRPRRLEESFGRPRARHHLAYRAPSYEGGIETPFNFSRSTLAARWAAGERDMKEAIRRLL
jgi:hypothetical protein